jgi:outer membrane protein
VRTLKKYLFYFLFVLSLTGLSQTINAQELRLGFVNTARIMNQAPQAEAARERLKNEFKSRDEKIVSLQNDLKKLEDEMSKNTAVMSETVRKKNERNVVSLKRDIKRAKEEFNEDLNIRRNEELTKLQKQVYETIVALAKEKKYDVILGDSVLYASERVDLTEQVLEKLKNEFNQQSATPSAQ